MVLAGKSTMDQIHNQQLPGTSNMKVTAKRMTPSISTSVNNESTSSSNGTTTKKGKTNVIRKRLGCRRSLKDMLSPEEQRLCIDDEDVRQDSISRKHELSSSRSLREFKPQRRLVFTSPRVISSDEDLFPSNHSLYRDSSDRWHQISEQAGSHRQDGTVMNIGRRPSTPIAFRMGMMDCAAVRVRSLNLWLDHEKDTLPAWLTMISEVFVNLEHLTLTEDIFPGEDDFAVSARMRRLYVLSILPKLKSIEDMVVTPKERKMANPLGCSEQLNFNKDASKSLNSDSIIGNRDQDIHPRTMSMPVSIDSYSDGSSRVDRIEVEFLAEKFLDLNCTDTATTTNNSPTTNSEITGMAADADDRSVFAEDGLVGAVFVNDIITVPQILPIHKEFNSFRGNSRDDTHTEAQETSTRRISKHHFDNVIMEGVPTRSTNHSHHQNPICNNVLNADDNMKKNVARVRVRAFHCDSSNNIELVSVASNDQEWTASCGLFNFRKKNSCVPRIRLPSSSGDVKAINVRQNSFTQAGHKSMKSLRSKGREKENSNLGARTPKACTPVQRQSKVIVSTPQVECCQILKRDSYSKSRFSFPTVAHHGSTNLKFSQQKLSDVSVSANQHVPPSKSLSTPFPMQFRERMNSPCIPTTHLIVKTSNLIDCGSRRVESRRDSSVHSEMEIITSPLSAITTPISSPKLVDYKSKTAQKGELPPPCASGKIRRTITSDSKHKERKKNRRRNQQHLHNVLKENARFTSVMDLDDEVEVIDNYIENSQESGCQNGSTRCVKVSV